MLDTALQTYSPGSFYETAEDPDGIDGLWYTDWTPGPNGYPAPSRELLESLIEDIAEQGGTLTFEQGMQGFVAVMSTTGFGKIMDAADKRASILLYGVIAIAAMVLYLFSHTAVTGGLARAAWKRFASYARRYRDLTGITDEDVAEFNTTVAALHLPTWLALK